MCATAGLIAQNIGSRSFVFLKKRLSYIGHELRKQRCVQPLSTMMALNLSKKRTFVQTMLYESQDCEENLSKKSLIFQGDTVWHLRTQKYESLHINKRVLACMCDVPVVKVCKMIGVSETFMKKNRFKLSLDRWPHSHLCFEECCYINMERDKLIGEIEELISENSGLQGEEVKKRPYFYESMSVDYQNLLEILKNAKRIAQSYNLPGDMPQKIRLKSNISKHIKLLFGVDLPVMRQSVNWNRKSSSDCACHNDHGESATNDHSKAISNYENETKEGLMEEEDIEDFIQNVLWTPISQV